MDYLRFVLALVVVMGLILLLGIIFRKLVMSGSFLQGALLLKKGNAEAQKPINIKESRVLDTRRRIMVLQYGDYEYVLLLTHQGDMLLDKIACDTAIETKAMTTKPPHTMKHGKKIGDKSLVNNTGRKPVIIKKTGKKPTM